MRIALVISSLGPGGAERVMALIASELVGRGHDVSLITLAPAHDDFFRLDPRVQRLSLGVSGSSVRVRQALAANTQRIRALRRAVMTLSPQAVVSFMTHTNVLMLIACLLLPVRVLVSERVDPASHRDSPIWEALRWLLYPRAAAVVVQTERIAAWFRRRSWRPGRVVIIPNPAVPCEGLPDTSASPSDPFILGAGRLVHQKGFDLLIRAFAIVAGDVPRLRLVIAGDGPEAERLRDLVDALNLGSRVTLAGNVQNLASLMRCADVFVLSSRYEGFPNVLLEALACGAPSVATDCPDGPRQILEDGKYGLLVPCDDPAALAAAITRLLGDGELRRRLAALGPVALTPYDKQRVVDAWESVLAPSDA